MLGAIYGDKAGSIYEFNQTKKIIPINPKELITDKSFYSDDTIETIAVMDAIINKKDYEATLKEYILKYQNYKPIVEPYFEKPFSPNTMRWVQGVGDNHSKGNGALMRISPVGYLFDTENEVIENAKLVTIPSHNSTEAVNCSTIIALMIYYFRKGYTKEEVYSQLKLKVEYKPFKKFNLTCKDTLGNCLYVIYHSTSFEDAIRKSLLMGGDTDTNACIIGSVAEAIYGMNEKQQNDAMKNLPSEFVKVLSKVYE